jgi:hypothetical protein
MALSRKTRASSCVHRLRDDIVRLLVFENDFDRSAGTDTLFKGLRGSHQNKYLSRFMAHQCGLWPHGFAPASPRLPHLVFEFPGKSLMVQ